MCRFVLYLGPPIRIASLVVDPVHSLIHQSHHSREREEPLNGDGFGLGWYERDIDPEPAVFRAITPAWSNRNLMNLARVIRSGCIAAHVRAATPGLAVTELNCHPFRWHNLLMMHNGEVGGFHRVRRRLTERLSDEAYQWIEGTTDSEHVFALFIDAYQKTSVEQTPVERIASALAETVATVDEVAADIDAPSNLNLAITDGSIAVVTRYARDAGKPHSLYACAGSDYSCVDGICRMTPGEPNEVALIASEPLGPDDAWRPVTANHMLLVHGDRRIEERALKAVGCRL